jgi:hypothetical protein
MSEPSIYEMHLHQTMKLTNYSDVMRVPGGWVYSQWEDGEASNISQVFVPFNNEFNNEFQMNKNRRAK